MAYVRTKVDALKDLGEKVTGQTIGVEENETIVGVLDKITAEYSGGGGGGGGEMEKETIWLEALPSSTIPELLDDGIEKLEEIFTEFNYGNDTDGRNLPDILMFDLQDMDSNRYVVAGNIVNYSVSYDGSEFYVHFECDGVPYVIKRNFFSEQWTIAKDRNKNIIVLNTYDDEASGMAITDQNDVEQLDDLQYKFMNGMDIPKQIMFDYRDEGNYRHVILTGFNARFDNGNFTITSTEYVGGVITIEYDEMETAWTLTIS